MAGAGLVTPAGAAGLLVVAVPVPLTLGLTEMLDVGLLEVVALAEDGGALLEGGGALLDGRALLLDGGALGVGAALLLDGGALLVGAALVRAVVAPVPALGTEPIGASEVGVFDGLTLVRGLTLLDTACPGNTFDGSLGAGSRTSSSPPAVRAVIRTAAAAAAPTSGPRLAPAARRCGSSGS